MKPFNLEEYLANLSHKVVTRNGLPVRILCTDAKSKSPVVALIEDNGEEHLFSYNQDGAWSKKHKSEVDLFFATEHRTGWVNIQIIPYTDELEASIIFGTKEEAELYSVDNPNYIATTKIEWEE